MSAVSSPDSVGESPGIRGAVNVADRDRLAQRLESAVSAHRSRVSRDERDRPLALLDALAEFAAGAGHELNNPLAVILGRAPTAADLSRRREPHPLLEGYRRSGTTLRSTSCAILMFVARPPAPATASLLQPSGDPPPPRSATSRIPKPRLGASAFTASFPTLSSGPGPTPTAFDIWPTCLFAMPLKPPRSAVKFAFARKVAATLCTGPSVIRVGGSIPTRLRRLLDPFLYCGRQAGRGLGMGLARAGRIVSRSGRGPRVEVHSPGTARRFRSTCGLDPLPGNGDRQGRTEGACALSNSLGFPDHRVSDGVAIAAKECHI